jgi:hypothetical protein
MHAKSVNAGSEPIRLSRGRARNWDMRKAIAELDPEQRKQLLYLADLGTSLFSSALVVCLLKTIVDLFVG